MIDVRLLWKACFWYAAFACATAATAWADDPPAPSPEAPTRWTIAGLRDAALIHQRRNAQITHEEKTSEEIAVQARRLGAEIALSRPLAQPGRVIPELKA